MFIKISKMFKFYKVFLSVVFFLSLSVDSYAQCAMCRAVLETEEGSIKAGAVNDGIVYLMIIPYLLVGIIGFMVYRIFRNKNEKSI